MKGVIGLGAEFKNEGLTRMLRIERMLEQLQHEPQLQPLTDNGYRN